MKSVRKHLLLHLMIALLMGSIIVGIVSYLSASDEINELYDEHLRQLAIVLEGQKSVLPESEEVNQTKTQLKGEEEFLIQIWSNNGKLVYSSHPRISYPGPAKRGFTTQSYNGMIWRSYATKPDGLILQVAQPLYARDEMIVEIAVKMLIPILLQFPIMGLFIWLAVGNSLESLSKISGDIQKRSGKSLEPLDINNIPEEIMPLVLALNGLLLRLDHSLQLQRQFTADAAHELRTPLTAIKLQLSLLDRSQSPDEKKEAMQTLVSGVDRSIRLVEQLLVFARIESDTEQYKPQEIDLAILVAESVRLFVDQAFQKNIDLGLVRHDSTPVFANADAIRTVINNLISNALRYTPENGRVDISCYVEKDQSVLEVADNGIGIPEAEHARIFDRFYRIAGNKAQGTGLGLAIVRSIVDKQGSSISLGRGVDGRGVSFKIIFPVITA